MLSLVILFASLGWVGISSLSRSEIPPAELATSLYQAPDFMADTALRIDINMADAASWASLPGIGETLSQRIVKFRDMRGGFDSIADLESVYGLSTAVITDIEHHLFVNPLSVPRRTQRRRTFTSRSASTKKFREVDINQADAAEFATLPGIGAVLSERIVKYRKKIGGFKQANDLAQVYNLPPETLSALQPYIKVSPYRPVVIAEARPQVAEQSTLAIHDLAASGASRSGGPQGTSSPKAAAIAPLDLNQADTAALVHLPGIGTKTAYRIVKFRDLIGFYVSIDQLQAVYGLSAENFDRMRPYLFVSDVSQYPKLDLNTATARALGYLPAFDKAEAAAFIKARKRKGFFSNWEEVQAIKALSPAQLAALQAYYHL